MTKFIFHIFLVCCLVSTILPTNGLAQKNNNNAKPNHPPGIIIGVPPKQINTALQAQQGNQNGIFQAQPSASLNQYRNGKFNDPDNSCTNWVNGNAGEQNSHYSEGWSMPYRCVMENLPIDSTITITFGYDIKRSKKHALDYLTHYDYMLPHDVCDHGDPECVDPLAGVSNVSGTITTFAIPEPDSTNTPVPGEPVNSFNAHPATDMTLFGGTITDIQYNTNGDLNASQSETTIDITFQVDSTSAVLAWGGHIASRLDWGYSGGVARSAGNINGSPFHMGLKDWTLNNLGNQDLSLSGAAVAPNCDLMGPFSVCSGGTSEYCVSHQAGQSYAWTVTGDGSISGSATDSCVNIIAGASGTYTVKIEISSGNNGLCVECEQEVIIEAGPSCSISGPNETCPNATDQFCGPAGIAGYAWSITGNGSISGPADQECVDVAAGGTCNGEYTLTLTLDDGTCTSSCTQVVLVRDITDPVITFCPPGDDLGCNPGGVPAAGVATATDACSTPTISSVLGLVVSDNCMRTQTRTYTATDSCGNTATCEQVFTWIEDTTPPEITFCPPGDDLGCNPSDVPAAGTATATDACGSPTISSVLGSVISDDCMRTQTRTYTATDGCGNTATCEQVFTWIEDTTPPEITFCPPGEDLGCNPGSIPPAGSVTATDACSTPTITSVLGSVVSDGCMRTQTRTYTATDGCGNTATCEQVFTWIEDTTPPEITFCPPGEDLGCNLVGGGVPPAGSATATDACGTPTISSGLGSVVSDNCMRTQTRTYTATDGCGNTATCEQVFTWIEDTTPPEITFCPPGEALGCNPGGVPPAGPATATDACGTPTISSVLGSVVSDGCMRTQTRTYTATDGCGNTATCEQVFTWTQDTDPPVFTTCPAGADLGCNPTDIPAAGGAEATDDCGTPTITSTLGTVMNNGCSLTQTRTYTATDNCGNTATCEQIFTWSEDSTPPEFTFCPDGDDLGCNPGSIPPPGDAIATDNCGTPVITSSLGPVMSNGCMRTQIRTYTATDGCGNTATCEQVFTWIADTTPPEFTFCPPGSDLGCNPAGVPDAEIAVATDGCGTPTITSALGSVLSMGCLRTQTRTYTAMDGCFNTATCTQVFTWIEDTEAPIFIFCPPNKDLGCNPAGLPSDNAVATDNCDAPIITSTLGPITANNCERYQTRTFTATDVCGNTSTCEQDFTWTEDITPPDITCPPDITVNFSNEVPPVDISSVDVSDNCGGDIDVVHIEDVIINQSGPNNYTLIRTYMATDECGNTAECDQIIMVSDPSVPSLNCPNNVTVSCSFQVPPVDINSVSGLNDNCGLGITVTHLGDVVTNQTCDDRFMLLRSYMATNPCGNSATCTQIINVFDNKLPVFQGLPPTVQTFNCIDPTPMPTVTGSDNCLGDVTVTFKEWTTHDPGSCINNYNIWREWRATDGCGNTAVFTGEIRVEDNTPPVFENIPPDITGDCVEVLCLHEPTVYDECGQGFIKSFSEQITCQPGLIFVTRTWVAADFCENTSVVVQNGIAIDNDPPRPMDMPADITIEVGDPLPPLPHPPVWGCDLCYLVLNVDVTFEEQVFQDKVLRIWTFCDCAYNCIADTQVITILTNKPPVFSNLPTVPSGTTLGCNDYYNIVDQVTATDPTDGSPVNVIVTDSIAYDDCGNNYTIFVTFTATDVEGGTSSTTIPILVADEDCIAINYCNSGSQDSLQEWIAGVRFGMLNNTSGPAAYSDFTNPPIQVIAGETYNITLLPGFSGAPQNENWAIWLDLNRDGVLSDSNERTDFGPSDAPIMGTFHIPITATTGNIRMRVAMSRDSIDASCGSFGFGEVEDYTLDISGPNCMPTECTPIFDPFEFLWEYINKVKLGGTMTNTSGASLYSDFRNLLPTHVSRGESYDLKTYSTSVGSSFGDHYWNVYADFNRDGDFSDPAELVGSQSVQVDQANFSLDVPPDAVPGLTTLRIVLSRDQLSNDCELVGYGEIEDYAIYIDLNNADSSLNKIQPVERNVRLAGEKSTLQWVLVPNPATDNVSLSYVSLTNQIAKVSILDLTGRILLNQNVPVIEGVNNIPLQIGQLQPGVYNVLLQSGEGIGQKMLVVVR